MADDQNMGGDRENQQLEKLKALKPVKYLSSLPPSLIKHKPPLPSRFEGHKAFLLSCPLPAVIDTLGSESEQRASLAITNKPL